MTESYETKQMTRSPSESTQEKMGKRVPSFFTSPSLVNLGGLGVGDQTNIHSWNSERRKSHGHAPAAIVEGGDEFPLANHRIEVNPGWAGMGLKGNHSSASLSRTNSGGSGLFVMDASDEEEENGEENSSEMWPRLKRKHSSVQELPTFDNNKSGGYIKTTSMANFYYRNSKSSENLARQASAAGRIESNKRDQSI